MEWRHIIVYHILMYVFVISPIYIQICEGHGVAMRSADAHVDNDHVHKVDRPCAVCPRNGVCVPRVQCPAHVRPGAHNPRCHLDGAQYIGVCCFTGSEHAGEADLKMRSAPIDVEDIKAAHHESHRRLRDWMQKEELLKRTSGTRLNETAPSFAHHLSMGTNDARKRELGQGGLLNMFAARELKDRQAISDDELAFGRTAHTDGPFCSPAPFCPSNPSRYRSIDGDCTNPDHPRWGAVNTGFERLLPPDYSDSVWAMRTSVIGLPLPSARSVSTTLLLDASRPSRSHNLMFMQFGQFIAHDISASVVFTIGNDSAISCCLEDGREVLPPEMQHDACAPILLDPEDPFYGQFRHRCINFVRAQLAPSSDCSVGYAKQMNGASHYTDLSHLYGSSPHKLGELRAPGGMLKVFRDYGRELPPLTHRKECLNIKDGAACFESGDNHANQIISLTVLHTIWTREHNRIARSLARLNPTWDEDAIFLEARRIVQAEYQHIIYNEWLPSLLGPQIMRIFGLSPSVGYAVGYDPRANPSLTVEFSAAAMRFGHSTVDGKMIVPNPTKNDVYESIAIPEVMFQPSRLRIKPFLDRMLLGLAWQPMQSVDPFVTEASFMFQLSRYMFHGGGPFGLDLASINIQRGRDYGVRSYNHYRKLIGLEPFMDFRMYSPNAGRRLSSVYASPEDVDLWVGGLLEEPVGGGVVGATFAHILADQFARMKKGDRYYYEYGADVNPGAFTQAQLAEIKKVSLARIICDNGDGIELSAYSPRALLRSDLPGNEPVPCNHPSIPTMDLSRFKQI